MNSIDTGWVGGRGWERFGGSIAGGRWIVIGGQQGVRRVQVQDSNQILHQCGGHCKVIWGGIFYRVWSGNG